MNRVTDILFDKTGTLTDRHVTLRRVDAFGDHDEHDVARIAAALEAQSEHPLAQAFKEYATGVTADAVVAIAGEGLEGSVAGRRYRIGTADFVAALSGTHLPAPARLADAGRYVFLGDADSVLARFELAEAARAGAAEAVQALAELEIKPLIASGDREATVSAFAERLGISGYQGELKPADKLALVRQLQQEGLTVAMVGDGINDSPVLAGANVSVAMGSGTSLAQHSADCVLMNEDLQTLTDAFRTARRTMRIVRQNLLWATCYNLIALPLAATGLLAPWMAALGMSASSLLVTGNALRISRMDRIRQVPPAAGQACAGSPALESAR
jgi:Cu2+-exporting ATPase